MAPEEGQRSAANPFALLRYASGGLEINAGELHLSRRITDLAGKLQQACTEYDLGIDDFHNLVRAIQRTVYETDQHDDWVRQVGLRFMAADSDAVSPRVREAAETYANADPDTLAKRAQYYRTRGWSEEEVAIFTALVRINHITSERAQLEAYDTDAMRTQADMLEQLANMILDGYADAPLTDIDKKTVQLKALLLRKQAQQLRIDALRIEQRRAQLDLEQGQTELELARLTGQGSDIIGEIEARIESATHALKGDSDAQKRKEELEERADRLQFALSRGGRALIPYGSAQSVQAEFEQIKKEIAQLEPQAAGLNTRLQNAEAAVAMTDQEIETIGDELFTIEGDYQQAVRDAIPKELEALAFYRKTAGPTLSPKEQQALDRYEEALKSEDSADLETVMDQMQNDPDLRELEYSLQQEVLWPTNDYRLSIIEGRRAFANQQNKPEWQRMFEQFGQVVTDIVTFGGARYGEHQRILEEPISPELRRQTEGALKWDRINIVGNILLTFLPVGKIASLGRKLGSGRKSTQFSDEAITSLKAAGVSDDVIKAVKEAVEEAQKLDDVSAQFTSKTSTRGRYVYEQTSGELGVPSQVVKHRDRNAQRRVSRGTGEHAGHRIGARFGAPGGEENLALQNAFQNSQGTYYQLENRWADKLERGYRIRAKVTDVYRKGESRPAWRKVEWEEMAPDGTITKDKLDFMNTYSPRSREAQGIPKSRYSEEQNNSVTDLDRERARRRPNS